jgi:hypothetical protein
VISAPYLGKVRRREAAGLNLITRVANARHNTLSNASATLWLIGLSAWNRVTEQSSAIRLRDAKVFHHLTEGVP